MDIACTARVINTCKEETSRGTVNCPELHNQISGDFVGMQWCELQPWIQQPETRVVNLPVGPHSSERTTRFRIDAVVEDEEYLKPVPSLVNTLNAGKRSPDQKIVCTDSHIRKPVLLYIARVSSKMKGVMTFLKLVDPKLLRGYRVEFYSGSSKENAEKQGKEREAEMLAVAAERGIQIRVHLLSVSLQEIYDAACSAAGLIHYAR